MSLRIEKVINRLPDYPQICRLMKTAFPEDEQIPLWALRVCTLRKGVFFRAFYDEEQFCGIAYTVESEKYAFVLFLAVNDKIRSKGYGTQIIQWLKHETDKIIVLNVEQPDSTAANAQQREKRIEFYRRNGITDTGYVIPNGNDRLLVLASDTESFAAEEFEAIVNRFFLGLNNKEVVRR